MADRSPVLCDAPECDRLAADGLRLCGPCADNLARDLDTIAATWDDLTRALGGSGQGRGEKVRGTPEQRLPINDRVSEARKEITHWIHFLAHIVMDERGLRGPDSGTIPSLARWLGRHATWLAAHPDAGSWADDARKWAGQARTAAYPSGRRRFIVRPCPADGCVGVISAHLAPVDDLLPSVLRCDRDATHSWTSDQWVALGRRLREAEQKAAEEAAQDEAVGA